MNATFVPSDGTDLLEWGELVFSVAALVIAVVALRATRREPVRTEVLRAMTALVNRRAAEWRKKMPRPPPLQRRISANIESRRADLEQDAVYRDVIGHHLPLRLRNHSDLWDEAIRLESSWIAKRKALEDAAEVYAGEALGLAQTPIIKTPDEDGTEWEEVDESAVDVRWSGFSAVLLDEVLTSALTHEIAQSTEPWGEWSFEWRRRRPEDGPPEPDAPFDLVRGETYIATVPTLQRRDEVNRMFTKAFLDDLRHKFRVESKELLQIHARMTEVSQILEGHMDELSFIPLLSSAECPYIRDAVEAVKSQHDIWEPAEGAP